MAATTNTTHRKRVFALIFGGCGFSLVATTTTTHQPPPTTTENEHECSISAVVGFFWVPPPPRFTTTDQPPHILRNRAFMLVFSGCGLPLLLPPRQPIDQPPQLPKSSIHTRSRLPWLPPYHHPSTSPQLPKSSVRTRFQRLWAVFACRHYGQLSTIPTTTKIERLHSFLAVVDCLCLPPLRPTINHPHNRRNRASALIFGSCGLSFPSNVPQISTTPPSRARLDFVV